MKAAISIFALFVTSACSPVSFSADTSGGTNGAAAAPPVASAPVGSPSPIPTQTSCSGSVALITRQTKILFVVDTSGSNASSSYNEINGQNYLVPATDPSKQFRGGAIESFVNRYGTKNNFSWGFVTFSNDRAVAYVNNGRYNGAIFSSLSAINNALNIFAGETDSGSTPYHAALAMADNAVSNDPDLTSVAQPQYLVIMLTDGFPSDYRSANGDFQTQKLTTDIDQLLAIAPGRVKLSTVYYGQVADPNAVQLLQFMATQGAGQFANVTNPADSTFQIDDVIPNQGTSCP